MTSQKLIRPVVLCGGSGTRLWPMSREEFPKQLLRIAGPSSMLSETLLRFADPQRFGKPIIMTNEALRFSVAEQLRLTGLAGAIVLEPAARNTAPAAAAAAALAMEEDPDAVLLMVPSDHIIRDIAKFHVAVNEALSAAQAGYLVTFGLRPTRPETGYGYIRLGPVLPAHAGIRAVASFTEKPNLERAQMFLDSGDYLWNGGMFLFSAASYLAELERHAPAVCTAIRSAVAGRRTDLDFVRLEQTSFSAAPNISIDYAVMEPTERAATVPCDIGWTDVGSWSELWEIGEKDASRNIVIGDVVAEHSNNCYIRSEGPLTAVVGVDDLVVIATDDATLVTRIDQSQNVKLIVERLRAAGRKELITPSRVYRPWGYFQSLHEGDRFQVKRLTINPGAMISLQKHYHRAEHWVVVSGTAWVTRGDSRQLLSENESIQIPLGVPHRLENPGKVPLNLIEVRSGEYLGEDDVVRIEDVYGRVENTVGKRDP